MGKETIGSFIAILRKSKGYTQQILADKIGVSSKTVSKWECDDGMPDIMILPTLAEVLEVSIEELLAGRRFQNNAHNSENNCVNNGNKSDKQIKVLFRLKENKFKNLSLLSVGMSLMSIVLQTIFLLIQPSSSATFVLWIFSIAFVLAGIITHFVNINNTISAINLDDENVLDMANYSKYKKAIKTTIYNWSYCVFALALISVVLCVFSLCQIG